MNILIYIRLYKYYICIGLYTDISHLVLTRLTTTTCNRLTTTTCNRLTTTTLTMLIVHPTNLTHMIYAVVCDI